MIWPLIYGGNVSKNVRPIELHWVTCRYATYLRTERSLDKFIVRPFGYVWFWKIVAVQNYDPTHALRVLARARRLYLFAPRVLSENISCISLSFSLSFSLSLSHSYSSRSHCLYLPISRFLDCWSLFLFSSLSVFFVDSAFPISDTPAFRQNMQAEETTLYNITTDTYRYAFLSDKSRTSRGNVRNFGEIAVVATRIFDAYNRARRWSISVRDCVSDMY